jgi:hypothetical protein
VVAIDGANASRDASFDYEAIAREILEQVKATDAAEDAQFGEARGDELPPHLSTHSGRRAWLRDVKRRYEDRRDAEKRPVRRSREKRLVEAKRRLREHLQVEQRANDAYEAYRARGVMKDGRRFGGPPKVYQPPEVPGGNVNVTDPDSQLVKTRRGWIQGYNAQAACNEDQIVIAAEITSHSPDFGHLEPMIDAVETELVRVGGGGQPEMVLADAGYWHQLQMERIVSRGTQLLIPPDSRRRDGERPGWSGGY